MPEENLTSRSAPTLLHSLRAACAFLNLASRLGNPNIFCMAIEDLTKAELAAVVQLLCDTIAGDRSLTSPRIDTLKSALVKLDPSAAPVRRNPLPSPKER